MNNIISEAIREHLIKFINTNNLNFSYNQSGISTSDEKYWVILPSINTVFTIRGSPSKFSYDDPDLIKKLEQHLLHYFD